MKMFLVYGQNNVMGVIFWEGVDKWVFPKFRDYYKSRAVM